MVIFGQPTSSGSEEIQPTPSVSQEIKDAQVVLENVEDRVEEGEGGMPGMGLNSFPSISAETSLSVRITNRRSTNIEIGAMAAQFFADGKPKCGTLCFVNSNSHYTCIYSARGQTEPQGEFTMAGQVIIGPAQSTELQVDTGNCDFGALKPEVKRAAVLVFQTKAEELLGIYTFRLPPTERANR